MNTHFTYSLWLESHVDMVVIHIDPDIDCFYLIKTFLLSFIIPKTNDRYINYLWSIKKR